MKGAVVSMLVLVASVQFMVKPAEAITCGDVDSDLFACVPYLTGKGGDDPPPQCCAGVIKLKNSAVSVADKQAACKCVQSSRLSHLRRLIYHGRTVTSAKPKPEFLFKDHENNSTGPLDCRDRKKP
ncbi:hypothetical protein OIU76_006103 [Salix suchowensis]|nr:hypothetical protein OIU76_006103 [Salix suchowensis]